MVLVALASSIWADEGAGVDPALVADAAALAAENPEMAVQAAKLFGFGIDLGVDTLPIPGSTNGATQGYQRFGFKPELNLGQFGVGLDLTLRAKINIVGANPIEVYLPDWVPDYMGNGRSFLDIYLPKILFLRYGQRGGPIYLKLGSIDDLSIGNGFIMGNYSNTRFLPEQRIFGLGAGLDGSLFNFPYLGLEFAAGNLARFDVVGGRVYARPLAFLDIPILKGFELGYEQVFDFDPYLYGGAPQGDGMATVWGIDARAPIIPKGLLTMVASADMAMEEGDRMGAAVGLSGSILGFLPYSIQLRYLEDGFIPTYFDTNYDIYRSVKHDALQTAPSGDAQVGWYALSGLSLLEGKVFFSAQMDGPFAALPAPGTGSISDYPHLKAVLGTAEGLIGGFSLNASYEKYYLGDSGNFWSDLISAENAQIKAELGYKTGLALISLVYNLAYDPVADTFDVTSSLQTSVKY
jgi:hypothetical protein